MQPKHIHTHINGKTMKIVGLAVQGKSDFNQRKDRPLIADNHTAHLTAESIADGVDLVVAQLDSQTDGESWVDLIKKSPYFIKNTDA